MRSPDDLDEMIAETLGTTPEDIVLRTAEYWEPFRPDGKTAPVAKEPEVSVVKFEDTKPETPRLSANSARQAAQCQKLPRRLIISGGSVILAAVAIALGVRFRSPRPAPCDRTTEVTRRDDTQVIASRPAGHGSFTPRVTGALAVPKTARVHRTARSGSASVKRSFSILATDQDAVPIRAAVARLQATNGKFAAVDVTDDRGIAVFEVKPGEYSLSIDHAGFVPIETSVRIRGRGIENSMVLRMTPPARPVLVVRVGNITGSLTVLGIPLPFEPVELRHANGQEVESARTNRDGKFSFRGVAIGAYVLRAQSPVGLDHAEVSCLILNPDQVTRCSILMPSPVFRFAVREHRFLREPLRGILVVTSMQVEANLRDQGGDESEGFAYPLRLVKVRRWRRSGITVEAGGMTYRFDLRRQSGIGDTDSASLIISAVNDFRSEIATLIHEHQHPEPEEGNATEHAGTRNIH